MPSPKMGYSTAWYSTCKRVRLFLEMLPAGVPSEIIPGIGAFQAASAALKISPPYGYDTNAV